MATLNINGQSVTVDDSFLKLSPDQQNVTVDEIAKSIGAANKPLPDGRATRAQRGEDAMPEVSGGEAFTRGAMQGTTFGFADELNALRRADPNAAPLPAPRDGPMSDNERMFRSMRKGGDQGVSGAVVNAAKMLMGDQGTRDAYDTAVRDERAGFKNAAAQRPLTTFAGMVAGGAPIPLGPVNSVGSGIRAGAVAGGLYGAGEGEGLAGTIGGAASGAAGGAVIGGALGGLMGKFSGPTQPAPATPLVEASERLGVPMARSTASESPAIQALGKRLETLPMGGDAMRRAGTETVEALGTVADDTVARLGSGDRYTAGERVGSKITDWITGKSREVTKRAYDAVDAVVNPAIKTELTNTRAVAGEILAKRGAANMADESGAVKLVQQAVENGDGLTYDGLKMLRTSIGERLKASNLPADISQGELKRIYGALSDDLAAAVKNAGGDRGAALFQRANTLNAQIATRRKELAKIVGEKGDASPEAVFDRLASMASGKARGNIELLAKARNAVGADDWREVGSAVLARMGRNADGELTPDRFLTAWGGLSTPAKGILFDKATRQSLDDIATISSRMVEVGKKYGNPSGTAQNVTLAAFGAGLVTNPVQAMATALGGSVLARVLSQPATAASAAKWSRAYEAAVRKPTAGTISALQIASRNLSATVSDKLGVNVTADQIMKAITGPRASYSETDQKEQR